MCGRFGVTFDADTLKDRFNLGKNPPSLKPSYNIAPSQEIVTITKNSPAVVRYMHWGFVPEWADIGKIKMKPINARDDKVFESGFYKAAIENSRCIIPVSFFYEWKRFTLEGKGQKQPYLIKLKKGGIMGLAGIYSEVKQGNKSFYTAAIITTKPNALMNKIHDRMPVIIDKKDEVTWMSGDTDIKDIKKMLTPFDTTKMEAWRISKEVNSPKNNYEDLTKRIT